MWAAMGQAGLSTPARANGLERPTPAAILAQAGPTPFCRRANRRLDIYSQPSVSNESQTRATIERGTDVFIVEQRSGEGFVVENGFAEVIVPSANSALGYVIARHLTGCIGQNPLPRPDPQPTTRSQCATVAVPFLNVRTTSSTLARTLGEVRQGQTVRILGDRQSTQNGRLWANITFGSTTGWVAETGSSGTLRNLSDRFPCPQS
ncbi:MAG: SH3 domain-containing protein [Elainellaceae cyanobacterium]